MDILLISNKDSISATDMDIPPRFRLKGICVSA